MGDYFHPGGFGDDCVHHRSAFDIMTQEKKAQKGSVLAKLFLLAAAAVLVFVSVSISKEAYKRKQIQAEIDKLRAEADKVSWENSLLREKIVHLESVDYREKEAKDKLSLQSPDEQVIVVKPSVVKQIDEADDPVLAIPIETPKKSNMEKWWGYFFK